MKAFHFFSFTICITAFFPTGWTLLTVRPSNVTVQANRSTYFNCSTNSEKGVKWIRDGDTLCAGLTCFDPYNKRFRVENITSTGSWNLIISNVMAEDEGDYTCEEIGFDGDKRSAKLIVSEIDVKETIHFDTTTVAAIDVKTSGRTIAAVVICAIIGIVIFIIGVIAVRKCRNRTQHTEEETHEMQSLMGDGVYIDPPILVKIITTRIANEKNSYIRAVSVFKNEVFLVTDNCSEIEVYDVVKLDLKHCLTIDRLINPLDMKPCLLNNCLYIFDCEYVGLKGKVLKINSQGDVLAEWPMEDSGARLSVSSNGNVVVSLRTKNKIVEYSSDGIQVCEIEGPNAIEVPGEIEVTTLRHAVLLENRQFLICQGYLDHSELHRVSQVVLEDGVTKAHMGSNNARTIKAFGSEIGSDDGKVNMPWYLVVDKNGCILVAERDNKRVTLLSPSLEFKRILISVNDDLQRPLNMFMDVPRGRLFVSDFRWDGTRRVGGRLLVFKIRN